MTDERDSERAMDKLLTRSLRRGLDTSGKDCPGPEVLAAYYERSLTASEAARWEGHFSGCARCQQQLAALACTEPVPAPPVRERAARLPWLAAARNWRWVAPGAAAAALAFWIALRPAPARLEQTSPPSEQPVAVAPSQPRGDLGAPQELAQRVQTPAAEASRKTTAHAVPAKPDQGESASGATRRSKREADEIAMSSGAKDIAPPPSAQIVAAAPVGRDAYAEKAKDDRAVALAGKEESQLPMAQAKAAEPVITQESAPQLQAETKSESGKAGAKQPGRAAQAVLSAPMAAATAKELADKTAAKGGAPTGEPHFAYSQAQPGIMALRSGRVLIASPNSVALWRLLPGGTIERSRDGGKTWQGQVSNVDADLAAGSAPSETVCWLVGRGGTVLRTTDGERWEKVSSPAQVDLVRVEARDALHALVTAADGRSYLTRDGGQSWRAK